MRNINMLQSVSETVTDFDQIDHSRIKTKDFVPFVQPPCFFFVICEVTTDISFQGDACRSIVNQQEFDWSSLGSAEKLRFAVFINEIDLLLT